ncbi:MAG: IS21 family transposase, partial [Clostridiaceae bacterium]
TVVYDNTKVAVRRFVGDKEKEATEALLKLSLYYKFNFRFCNAYRGNEKGHVERSVEYIRRKAFSRNIIFNSLDEANRHLEEILESINLKKIYNSNKSAKELLDEEKEFLLPEMPIYETAKIQDCRVNKYSSIMIDSCYYSVPDSFVGVMVRCKIYSSKILIYYNEEKIAEHNKVFGTNRWSINIDHYMYTLTRKPKALVNSTAFSQLNYKLRDIYAAYFTNEERDFIKLIQLVGTYGLSKVECAISELKDTCPTTISIDKIEFICRRKEDEKVIYLENYNSDIVQNSISMLDDFNNLLNN